MKRRKEEEEEIDKSKSNKSVEIGIREIMKLNFKHWFVYPDFKNLAKDWKSKMKFMFKLGLVGLR